MMWLLSINDYRWDTPNDLQYVPIPLIMPSTDNVRLFNERTSLAELERVYTQWKTDQRTVLPDAPIVRPNIRLGRFELLAGERRLTAARNAGVEELPVRISNLMGIEAYDFILKHNDVAGLTTVELAFRAAEMERLGYTDDHIAQLLKGASVGRYLTVGRRVNPHLFSDTEKLCDPSIVEWFEAAEFGQEHFDYCFQHWNEGLWDEKRCAREFRRRGRSLPLDNAEKGFRLTRDGSRLVIRGQLDLDVVANFEDALAMIHWLQEEIDVAKLFMLDTGYFGARAVTLINPTTLP